MCSALVLAHLLYHLDRIWAIRTNGTNGTTRRIVFARPSSANEMQISVMFQWLTNALVTLPFVPMVPINKSFLQGSQVLMICGLHLVHQSVKELTILFVSVVRFVPLVQKEWYQWYEP